MFRFIGLCLGTLVRLLRARRSLLLENLALRQQLAVLKRRHPRPRLDLLDKLFWVVVRRFWSGWQQSRVVKKLERLEMAWLRILHRLPFRMGFCDLETAPTISLSRSYRLEGNLRCFGRACSPM